jgi:uncharacterized protein (DUF169 family)
MSEKLSAQDIKALGEDLNDLLRIQTLAVGMKLFEDLDEMNAIPGLRTPSAGKRFGTCQLVTQSRIAGFTLGIVADNLLPRGNCGAVPGLNPVGPEYLSGEKMGGVWFKDREQARLHQEQMPRVEPGRYKGLVVSPLRSARLDPPDVVLFYGSPGQIILFINGLQHGSYKRFDFSVTGESACADSWGLALKTREPSLSIPCYAERRFGGVQDHEMLMALPPADLKRGIDGLKALRKAGLRYPIFPYGSSIDPQEGLAASYGERKE